MNDDDQYDYWNEKKRPTPDLFDWLTIVAIMCLALVLGIICRR